MLREVVVGCTRLRSMPLSMPTMRKELHEFLTMHACTCDPVPTVMGLRLVTLRAAGAPLPSLVLRTSIRLRISSHIMVN